MIPLKVESPVYRRPFVVWAIIALNVLAFLAMKSGSEAAFQRRIFQYSTIPYALFSPGVTVLLYQSEPVAAVTKAGEIFPYRDDIDLRNIHRLATSEGTAWSYRSMRLTATTQVIPAWLTILTAMFMHGGWLHLIGNMWFLYVFGAAVEDVLGRIGFTAFYLVAGLAAAAAHVLHDAGALVPCLGASGAIAGVMGGFAMLFPRSRVLTVIPVFGFWTTMYFPAIVYLLLYLGEQVMMSIYMPVNSGGVAWWAHIGGFVAGFLLARVFPARDVWVETMSRRRTTGRRFGYDWDPPRDPHGW